MADKLTLTPDEIAAWDRFAAGALAMLADPEINDGPAKIAPHVAKYADALILERRKRLPPTHWRLTDGSDACGEARNGEKLTGDQGAITCEECQRAAALSGGEG